MRKKDSGGKKTPREDPFSFSLPPARRAVNHGLFAISIFSVFLILLFSSLFSYIYDINYYSVKFRQYGIYEKYSEDAALNQAKSMLGYLQYKNSLDKGFFSEDEESHLNDVRLLLKAAKNIYIATIFFFWAILGYFYFIRKQEFSLFFQRTLLFSGIISLVLLLFFCAICIFLGFDTLFSGFHRLFFAGNYSFDPSISNMKALLPDRFFFDIGLAIVIRAAVKSALILSIGIYMKKSRVIGNSK